MNRATLLKSALAGAAGLTVLGKAGSAEAAKTPLRIQICVVNRSKFPLSDVEASLVDLQTQIDRDYYPVWGLAADLYSARKARSASDWVIYLPDYLEDMPEALGYHYLTTAGKPVGYVGCAISVESGLTWQEVLSHELLEMLGDPYAPTLYPVNRDMNEFYVLENADPVEADKYRIGKTIVSNFVHPSWFMRTVKRGKYDHMGLCKRPLEVRKGGYQIVFKDGMWGEIQNFDRPRLVPVSKPQSRRRRPK